MLTSTSTAPVRRRLLVPRDTLDDLLRGLGDLDAHTACLLCDGDTFTVLRRSGVRASVCRTCGTSFEDDGSTVAIDTRDGEGTGTALRVA
jgi:hypothetical protein